MTNLPTKYEDFELRISNLTLGTYVSSMHLLKAHTHAGLPPPSLHAGSVRTQEGCLGIYTKAYDGTPKQVARQPRSDTVLTLP